MFTVYLAGGFRSGWQDRVIEEAGTDTFQYLDPRSHSLSDKAHYTMWDLEAIRRCDLIFAFLEKTNPGGYALSFEIGFAKALGKRIIFIDEKSAEDQLAERYLGMVHAAADVVLNDLDSGIGFLKSFATMARPDQVTRH